jgi:F0F1-type ATP synthase membrane subunit b/b'
MENLGINFIQIISYILIFIILYAFAKKFVNKVLETTEERKRTIENGLRNAEEAQTLKAEKLKDRTGETISYLRCIQTSWRYCTTC